jgi:hypothetical protein
VIDQGLFTVGVFQDADWARRGVEALLRDRFPPDSLSIMALESAQAALFIESLLGEPAKRIEIKALGPVLANGPLIRTLQGNDEGLTRSGIGGTIRRAGFQQHDGFIFETLTGRGGVLVSILSEPRAANALARLHAYGAGNAAIGAWTGRV